MKVSDGYIVFLFILSRLYILSPRFQINPRVVPWYKIYVSKYFIIHFRISPQIKLGEQNPNDGKRERV